MKSTQHAPESVFIRQRLTLASLTAALLAWGAAPALAEVSVIADSHGRPVRTLVVGESRGAQRLYWSPVRRGVDSRFLLNPGGDRMGDGAPIVGVQPGTRQPWVIWAAGDGHDLEIAFATWSQDRWDGPRRVDRSDNNFDDLNPRLAFDSHGRPVVAWWRKEPVPRIYLSVYRDGAWAVPLAISDATIPSWLPSVRIQGSQAVVTFHTSRGQTVLYQELSEVATRRYGNGPLDGPVPPPDAFPSDGDDGEERGKTRSCSPTCSDFGSQKPIDRHGD